MKKVAIKELDVSSMDACKDMNTKEIENQIYLWISPYIRRYVNLPLHAIDCIEKEMLRKTNKFELNTYSEGRKIKHMTGEYQGVTLSGWPFQTTFGNTVTMLTFGLTIMWELGLTSYALLVAGDNLQILAHIKYSKIIDTNIFKWSVWKNYPVVKGFG